MHDAVPVVVERNELRPRTCHVGASRSVAMINVRRSVAVRRAGRVVTTQTRRAAGAACAVIIAARDTRTREISTRRGTRIAAGNRACTVETAGADRRTGVGFAARAVAE